LGLFSGRSEAETIAEQRQQLEEERAKFTDAAIRLARERSDFEVRMTFYYPDLGSGIFPSMRVSPVYVDVTSVDFHVIDPHFLRYCVETETLLEP
jgi:hypothetical protein